MKVKIFSLSLLSMIAVPNGGAMETVDQTVGSVGQALISFYEVVKNPGIFNTLTGEKEEAQVQAAIADSLMPDLMTQKADAETQAALALSFLTTLGFQIGDGALLPLGQQIQNYIQAKEERENNNTILERSLLETTEAWNKEKAMLVDRLKQEVQERSKTERQLAEAAQAEEERKKAFSILEKKLFEMESTYFVMEKKPTEATREREEAKRQLTQILQEQVSTNNDVTVLSGIEGEFVVDLVQLTVQGLPSHAKGSKTFLFQYLDTLKNGINDFLIENAKKEYKNAGPGHVLKMKAAIDYLRIAQITINQVTEPLTKEHHAQIEANRIIMEKKLAEMAKEHEETKNHLTQILQEQVSTNNEVIALSGIEVELATDAVQTTDLTKLTPPTSVISSQSASVFFNYLDSLKNGQNASIIEGAKDAFNGERRAHKFKMLAAITYLRIAQITTNQVIGRLTKEHHAQMEANRIIMEKKLAEMAKEQEETKNHLTQILQEQVSTNNDVIALAGMEVELATDAVQATDLTKLTIQSIPSTYKKSREAFFSYLDTFKNGVDNKILEEAKNIYDVGDRGHAFKMQAAIDYLRIAQMTINQFIEHQTKITEKKPFGS